MLDPSWGDIETIRYLYEKGWTQAEIGAYFGVNGRTVGKAMQKHDLKRRGIGPRDQSGSKNPLWKGSAADRNTLHQRLNRYYGKPKKCDECGTTDPKKRYDWANLTGHYEDPNDYKRMCRSCHWKYDRKVLDIKHMRRRYYAEERTSSSTTTSI